MLVFIVVLALLLGAITTQLPSALGDDSKNPLGELWDAIFDLQRKDASLQAQIDQLRAEKSAPIALTDTEVPASVSDVYSTIAVDSAEDGRTLVHIIAANNGPERAAGVKLTAFYLMPLFEINSINDDRCQDKSRGIIECIIGILEAGQQSVVTIDATAREYGKVNTWTVDISTTTDDADYANNHTTYNFETGLAEPIEVQKIQQQTVNDESGEGIADEQGPEKDNHGFNSTGVEGAQEYGGNQTSNEIVKESSSSSNNSTSSQTQDDGQNTGSEGSSATATTSSNQTGEEAQEEQADDSETEQQVREQSSEEQGTSSEGSTVEPVSQGSSNEKNESAAAAADSSQEQQSNDNESSEESSEGDDGEQSESP